MYPKKPLFKPRKLRGSGAGERGIGLAAAVFLVLVVALLVVAIVRSVQTSGEAFARDVLSHRAFLAAESGVQLALNRLFPPLGSGACADRSYDLAGVGLPGCRALVACRSESVAAGTTYTLESAGRCDVGAMAAERTILVRAAP